MLQQCTCWESSGGNADTDAGQARHISLFRALTNAPDPFSGLSEEDAESVRLAADYVKVKAPLSVHPLRLEYHVNPLTDDFAPIFENGGTLDVACGPFLFDLKNKERDYTAQMAGYSLDMFQEQGWNEIEVHLWFCDTRRAQLFKLTEGSAHAIVDPIVAAVRGGDKAPTACDYCAWCAKRLSCPALLKPAATIARGREELSVQIKATFDTWVGAGAHTSQIEDPALMGAVLKVARVLADWCEAAEFRAKDLAIKEGKVPRGFKLQSRKGNRFISSVTAAFPLVGLPQADFLKACELKPSALFETYAAFHGLKRAQAERDVEAKLAGVIQRKPSTQSLVAEKKITQCPG